MFVRHFRRFERFNRISYNIQGGSVRRQGVVLRDNEHHPSNTKQNCLYISLMFPKLFVQLYNN